MFHREVVEQIAGADVRAGLGNEFRALHGLTVPIGGAVDCHLNSALLRSHSRVLVARGDIEITRGSLTSMDVLKEVSSVKSLVVALV